MQAVVNEKIIQLSEAGWLENLDEWSEELAVEIAKNEKIPELTQQHWDIINTAREYFLENGIVAEPRAFSKIMKKKYGEERSDQFDVDRERRPRDHVGRPLQQGTVHSRSRARRSLRNSAGSKR